MLLLLFGLVMAVLNSSAVQTRLGQWAANQLSEKLDAEVGVDKLDFDFFNRFKLEGVIVYDQAHDTLIYAKTIDLSVRRFNLENNLFRFGELNLVNAQMHLRTVNNQGSTNLDFLTEYFRQDTTNRDTSKTDIKLYANKLSLDNCAFSYHNTYGDSSMNALDLNAIDVNRINGHISDFRILNDTLDCRFQSFSFREKSGLVLDKLAGDIRIDGGGIHTTDLMLKTPKSEIRGDLALLHENWTDYRSFIEKINWDSEFALSTINLKDIGYFTHQLEGLDFPIYLEGNVRGTIDNLKGRKVKLTAGDRSIFRGSFDISGLPDAENAFIDLRVKQLSSAFEDLASIGTTLSRDSTFARRLPVELKRAGSIFFEGSFIGFPQDFVAYGDLTTEVGKLNMDLNLKNDSLNDRLVYDGSVKTENLNIGKLLAVEKLSTVAANAQINAYSRKKLLSGTIDGIITSLTYSGYTYHDLKVDGTVSEKMFEGKINARDPNLNFDFQGIVDFTPKLPILNFTADVFNANLTALQLIEDSTELTFNSQLALNAHGLDINDVNGTLSAVNTFICWGDSVLYLDDVKLSALGNTRNRVISFTSDIADMNLTGAFDSEELPQHILNLIAEVMPSFIERKPVASKQNFEFSLTYKMQNLITGFLVPGLSIAPNTTAYGSYNSANRILDLFLRSDSLIYKEYSVRNFTADMGKISEVLKGKFYANSVGAGQFEIENVDLDLEAYNDIVQVGLGWLNPNKSVRADLEGQVSFLDQESYVIDIAPGYIGSEAALYTIDDSTRVRVDSTHIAIDELVLHYRDQKLEIDGNISENKSEKLEVTLENFDFATLDSMGIEMAESLRGVVNLQGSIRDFYDERIVRATGTIDSLAYGKYELGDVRLTSRYFGEENKLALNGSLAKNEVKILDFDGDYNIGQENPLDGKLKLEKFNLELINAFKIPQINQYSGQANGEIAITGKLARPRLDGYIDFNNARFRVEYLNTYFTFSDRVRVEEDWFGIDYKPIYDDEGHKGFVVASAFHEDYKNWNYDISVEADNFFVMNTTREMNKVYYGTAYGSGTYRISGYEGFLEINIDAKTERGTSIKLPLDESEDVTLENFVHFVSKEDETHEEREADLSGVQLRLNVDATPDAEVQLIFDEKSGDIIRGRGSGKLTFEISNSGEFLMFGRYEIDEGSYLFTLKNLINKQFEVRRGGVIGWYGDPYNADIDIAATYQLRTPLYPIMVEDPDRYRGREDVNVVLKLTDKLMNPTINFDIELPQATETERSQLASATSTTQQLNQQVFSLLILNRFLPVNQTSSENQAIGGVSGLTSATTSDFVSSQISSWLSEISNEFDIGVNYRPGDQISNQEIAVALSTQLFNERLRVRGSFGVTSATESQYNPGQTNILGDFSVEYSLTEDGKIRLKVFNETNPYEVFSTSSSIYTQGVGLVYQEDFDTLDEFFDEIKGLFKNDKVKQENP